MSENVISLDQLTPAQMAQLKSAMAADRKSKSANRKDWNPIVDAMLQEREGDGFRWTTAQIVDKLQSEKVIRATLSKEERNIEIKKVQTRKQLLERKRGEDGKPLYVVGYKPSANGIGITLDRVLLWIKGQSATDQDTLAKALNTLITARTNPGSVTAKSGRK